MAGNSTEIIDHLSNVSFFQGIESHIVSATGLNQDWASVIVAIGIIVLSYIVAKAFKFFIVNVAPHLVSQTKTSIDDEILKAIKGPLQVFIVACGVYMALASLNYLPGLIDDNLTTIFTIVFIYIGAYLLSNLAGAIINWYKNDVAPRTGSDLDESLLPFVSKALGVTAFILATLMAMSVLNIEITPLLATLGVGGIAIALAAQELLSNLFGAFAILSDRPYKIGDRIQISSDLIGDVVEIGLRSTRLKTLDNRLIVVPNSDISKSNIINYTLPDTRVRLDITVGISYDADVDKASGILLDIAKNTTGALADPAPKVYVKGFGDFSVNLLMHVWISDFKLNLDVADHIYRETLKRFVVEKVDIPYPTTSVLLNRPRAASIEIEAVSSPIKK
jgi:MscS family membrane protein